MTVEQQPVATIQFFFVPIYILTRPLIFYLLLKSFLLNPLKVLKTLKEWITFICFKQVCSFYLCHNNYSLRHHLAAAGRGSNQSRTLCSRFQTVIKIKFWIINKIWELQILKSAICYLPNTPDLLSEYPSSSFHPFCSLHPWVLSTAPWAMGNGSYKGNQESFYICLLLVLAAIYDSTGSSDVRYGAKGEQDVSSKAIQRLVTLKSFPFYCHLTVSGSRAPSQCGPRR